MSIKNAHNYNTKMRKMNSIRFTKDTRFPIKKERKKERWGQKMTEMKAKIYIKITSNQETRRKPLGGWGKEVDVGVGQDKAEDF